MRILNLVSVLFICSYLFGCASGAKMEDMVFQGPQKNYSDALQKNMEVAKVSGGEKTNPAWTSEISNEAFSEAVKNSLVSQGLYSPAGKYQLEVQMIKVDQPMFGLDFEVTTNVRYTLTNTITSKVVLDETVIAPHTATMGDAFAAVKRLRLANEGSANKNIENFLSKLSQLEIDPKEISLLQ